ncbi:MAG: hypothetical protein ILP07_03810 [Treponema sp.]|nr:hypothetical protein [Treponema sp.]
MLRLAIVLIIISISLLFVVLEKIRENKNTEVEEKKNKELTGADKIGIIHLIFLFLVLVTDLIDTFAGNFLYREHRPLFEVVYNFEFVGLFILIPIFFITVLVKLIRSLKKEKKGSVIACISLMLNVVMGLVNAGTYASHF